MNISNFYNEVFFRHKFLYISVGCLKFRTLGFRISLYLFWSSWEEFCTKMVPDIPDKLNTWEILGKINTLWGSRKVHFKLSTIAPLIFRHYKADNPKNMHKLRKILTFNSTQTACVFDSQLGHQVGNHTGQIERMDFIKSPRLNDLGQWPTSEEVTCY